MATRTAAIASLSNMTVLYEIMAPIVIVSLTLVKSDTLFMPVSFHLKFKIINYVQLYVNEALIYLLI